MYLSPHLTIAERAARAAGDIIVQQSQYLDRIQIHMKAPNDFVSEVDLRCEREIIQHLRTAYPDYAILSEESGKINDADNPDYMWIIDPLDGTSNFLHGFPHYAVSIALMHKNDLVSGVIYDPIRNDLFIAERSKGATLNQKKIRISNRQNLDGAFIGTGIPYKTGQPITTYMKSLENLVKHACNIRRAGSAALDLAYVAAGMLDAFWEHQLNIWDIAAGSLLIQEAGGIIGDLSGTNTHLTTGNVLAANPTLFKKIFEHVQDNNH